MIFSIQYILINEKEKLAAVKVQKQGLSWEPIILSETLNRVRGSSIENAISDLYTACMFESGNGVLVTSYYKYGTLLDLCAHSRPMLVTKSPTMKPFIYFFGAQLLNLMHHLHQNGILHGDFKPDNIMLDDIQSFDEPFLNGKSQGKPIPSNFRPPIIFLLRHSPNWFWSRNQQQSNQQRDCIHWKMLHVWFHVSSNGK